VRELVDLPVADDVRCGYLNVLHVLLRNSPWVEHGSYRVLDIYNALVRPTPTPATAHRQAHSAQSESAGSRPRLCFEESGNAPPADAIHKVDKVER